MALAIRNLRIAHTLHRDRALNEWTFQIGDFVAWLDGQIVAVDKNADKPGSGTPRFSGGLVRLHQPDAVSEGCGPALAYQYFQRWPARFN